MTLSLAVRRIAFSAWALLTAGSYAFGQEKFFPVSVWYGGGKARAPMLEADPEAKRELWRKDLKQIKSLGFNTVRCWIDWATGEPEEGSRHFETLGVLLQLAEQEGLKVIVQVYMDSAPPWIGRRYPDSLFVSSNGEALKPESSPGYCIDHPQVRKADLDFYKALAAFAGKSPAFLGFDLWSEPHVINWATPTFIANPEFCFCHNTVARFRAWIRKRYGTLDALNRAWYRHFASWDEVEPSRMSTLLSYTDYIDWKLFIAEKLGEDLNARYQAVKSAAPDAVAVSHAAGVGLFSSPHWWEGQSDDWNMAEQVDYYGTSFYPKHSAGVDRSVPWRAALLDFARSFGFDRGRNGFWIGELQAGFGTIALNVSPTVTPEDLRIWTWSALARGAKGINYYAWYPMSSGYEAGGYGLIKLDGTITERAHTAGGIAQVVDRNQRLFLEALPPQARVAIVYNPWSHFVGGRQRDTAYGGPQGEVAGIERDSLLGAYTALFPTNVLVDFIHVNELKPESMREYKLIILPYAVMLPERAIPALTAYVQAGGILVTEARTGWNDEHGRASETIPGLGLDKVLGCRETDVQTARGGKTTLRWDGSAIPGMKAGDNLPGRWYEETLEPREGATVVARFENGAAAAVVASFGKGKTLTVGSFIAAAYQSQPSETARRLFAGLLQWAGVQPDVTVEGGTAEVRYLESGTDRLLFVFKHEPPAAHLRINLAWQGRYAATDLITGRALNSLELDMKAGDVAVLHLVKVSSPGL